MVLRPCIEFKPVERDALYADRDVRELRTHFAVEAVLVHAEIVRRVAQPDEAGREKRGVNRSINGIGADIGVHRLALLGAEDAARGPLGQLTREVLFDEEVGPVR